MRSASITFTNTTWASLGDNAATAWTTSAKAVAAAQTVAGAAITGTYIWFDKPCFRLAIAHIPVNMTIEFFDSGGVSKGKLYDLQSGDTGLEWSVPFSYIKITTAGSVGASYLEIWGFSNG